MWSQACCLTAQAQMRHKAGQVHCITEQREDLHAEPLLQVGRPSHVQSHDKALLCRCNLMQSNAHQRDEGHLSSSQLQCTQLQYSKPSIPSCCKTAIVACPAAPMAEADVILTEMQTTQQNSKSFPWLPPP